MKDDELEGKENANLREETGNPQGEGPEEKMTGETANVQEYGEETAAASQAHSTYKPEAFNDAIKYHLPGMYQDWFLDYAS